MFPLRDTQVSTYSATKVKRSLKISFFLGKEIMKNLRNIHGLDPEPFLYFGDPNPHKNKMEIGYCVWVQNVHKKSLNPSVMLAL